MMFSFKGASGMKPCCLCSNITLRLQVASHDRTSFLLPHSEWDVRKMVFATQASIQANVQELNIKRAANVSKAHFDKVESALGLAYSPHGPLWSQAFWDCLYDDLTNCIQFDWMHVYMVSGAWNTESGYLFELLKDAQNLLSVLEDLHLAEKHTRQGNHRPKDFGEMDRWRNQMQRIRGVKHLPSNTTHVA